MLRLSSPTVASGLSTEHPVAIGIRMEQNLLDIKDDGCSHDFARSPGRLDCLACCLFVTGRNTKQHQHPVGERGRSDEPHARGNVHEINGDLQCRYDPSSALVGIGQLRLAFRSPWTVRTSRRRHRSRSRSHSHSRSRNRRLGVEFGQRRTDNRTCEKVADAARRRGPAPARAWPAPTTNIVAVAAFDSRAASASPMTGGPSRTMKSKTSRPTDSNEKTRGLAQQIGGIGGQGTGRHEDQVRILGCLDDFRRLQAPVR